MEDRIFLLTKCTIQTTHGNIHQAIQELQDCKILQLSDTANVKVLKSKIMKMNTKTVKK